METYEPIFIITPEILNLVYDIAGILERINIIKEKSLTPKLRRENRIKTIHSSLWIEANTLTLEQVTDIMNGKRVIGSEKDILEAKNAIIAYDELLKCNPYNEKDLLNQHALLMNGLIKDAGKYRQGGIGVFSGDVPVHVAPPPSRVPILMSLLLEWTKKAELPQIVKSCIFHYEFEFIHPFSDGNGRMGRMWQTLLLYQENQILAWLPVETIIAQKQSEYYQAIRRSTQNNDSGIFTYFMLQAIKDSILVYKNTSQNASIEYAGINAGINAGIKLSKTQEKILSLIGKQDNITQEEIAKKIKISVSTVFRNIEKLKQLNLLSRNGARKDGLWVIKRGKP
ncbi:MAG: Fic family protein [Candidatus Cloacimonetes bacterium]|nr:Fic family protein [Candidatus Cloacimonadota bacterium]